MSPSIAMRAASTTLLTLAVAGCSSEVPQRDSVDSTTDQIIGGTTGGPDAVGKLFVPSMPENFCTATLVAPDLVLTAKHCAVEPSGRKILDTNAVFDLPRSTAGLVKVKSVHLAPTVAPPGNGDRYFIPDISSDTALFRLQTKITDIKPFAVSSKLPSKTNPRFVAAGFGRVSHGGASTKSMNTGEVTFRMNGGSQLQMLFRNVDDFLTAVDEVSPGFVDTNIDQLVDTYHHEILNRDYEMLFGGGPNDVQVCHGDSGGPLLQKNAAGAWFVYGDVSGSKTFGSSRCHFGSVYATFGPQTMTFLQSFGIVADPDAPAPPTDPAPKKTPDGDATPPLHDAPAQGDTHRDLRAAYAPEEDSSPEDSSRKTKRDPSIRTEAAVGTCSIHHGPVGNGALVLAALFFLVLHRRRRAEVRH